MNGGATFSQYISPNITKGHRVESAFGMKDRIWFLSENET
jgi:hypothetical protein